MTRQSPAPVLYPAATKAEAERHAPPAVLALCTEMPCCGCNTPVMPMKGPLSAASRTAAALGRRVEVLCNPCFARATANEPGPLVGLEYHDPAVRAQLARHHAEKN